MALDVRNSKNIKITVTRVDDNKPANDVVVNEEEERATGMVSQAVTINRSEGLDDGQGRNEDEINEVPGKSFLGSPPVKSIPGSTLVIQLQEELLCNLKNLEKSIEESLRKDRIISILFAKVSSCVCQDDDSNSSNDDAYSSNDDSSAPDIHSD